MDERESDDRMDMVEDVDSSSGVNKPYGPGMGEETLEIAETESESVPELVESSVGVCVGRDDSVAVEDKGLAGDGGDESGLENRVAVEVEGGGGITAARSDDPPVEIKVEEETKIAGDELTVDTGADELVVEPQLEMKGVLEMVGSDVGNVLVCSGSVMDARRDDLVDPQLIMKPEEEPVLESKVDVVGEENSDDFPMGARGGEVQAAREGTEPLDVKTDRGVGDVKLAKEVGKVDDELVDNLRVQNNAEMLVKGGQVDEEKGGVLANHLEVGTAETPADMVEEKRDPVITGDVPIANGEMNVEMITEVNACVANVGDQELVYEFSGSTECAGGDVGCKHAEENKDVDLVEGLTAGNNSVKDADMSKKLLKNSKLDEPVTVRENFEDSAVMKEASAGDIKNETEVGVELGSTGNAVMEESQPTDAQVGTEVGTEVVADFAKEIEVGVELRWTRDAAMEEIQPRDAQVGTEMVTEVVTETDVEVELGSTRDAVMEEIQSTDAQVRSEAETEVVADKTRDNDGTMELLKNSKLDETLNVQENLQGILENVTTKEEASAAEIEKGEEVGVELESIRNDVMEEIQASDARIGTEVGTEVVADKTRDDNGTMEMEETPSDVDEPGQENYDSPAAPQDEEGEKMVAEQTETQDTVMETETDSIDLGKTSGGKRKRGKLSKIAVPKAMAKTSKKKVGEDVCFICFDGGELVICDRRGCPKAYHPSCVNRDEAFFKSKGRWNCGWHLCSFCEKNAQYMCYTCTFSLCKSCAKDASFLCVRGNKGFCETCMRTVMLIESNEQENRDTQIDFDDKSSWEYLFKDYYIELKAKLSLSPVEIAQAKNPWKGANMSAPSKQESSEARADANDGGSSSDEPTENLESTRPKRRKVRKQSKSLTREDELISTNVGAGSKAIILADNCEWASKELLEFVSHMKNGDTSALSQFDVQALLLEYIKRNKLRDPRRKSQIICDARLENLFGKPRVGHFEMLKLLESHFLVRDEQNDDVQGSVVDVENNSVDTDGNTDLLTRDVKDRKRKSRKKGNSRGPQSNLDDYAAIDMHNIGLIYLRRKLMEDLLEDPDTFHDKVIGTFVRIRISGSTQKQDLYRLVQVVGTSKATEPYKIGKRTTDITVEILNLDKTEIISIDTISNQEFSEEECKRLRQSIKCGLISRLTVGEILDKTMELHTARVNDWLESETMRLSHLRDRASDLGRRKELRECVEKLQLLKTPEERQRRLEEIPEIHADPKMDPSYESEDKDSETEDSRQEAFVRSRSSSFNKRGRVPMSPGSDSSVKDSWGGAGKVSSKTWEPSRDLSSSNFSINAGHNGEIVIENSSTLGRDRGRQESNYLPKKNSAASSEPAEWALRSASRPESSSGATSITSQTSSSARSVENFVKVNESEKIWHYKDPSGKVQGPFSMVQLRKWNNTGYFPTDLKIWRTTEKQANSILLADALAGKIPKESSHVDNTLSATNTMYGSHTLTGHSVKASGTFSHQDKERPSTDQMSSSIPKLSTEKLLGNVVNLPSPTPKTNISGSTGVEGSILTGSIQSPAANGVLSSPTPDLSNIGSHSSAPASVLSSVLQAVALSSIPNSQTGSLVDSAVSLHAQSTPTREPLVQMHSNPQATVQPVQTVAGQNLQTNTQGWAAVAQTAQPQGYGWSPSHVQNSSGSFSNSGTPSGHQPDVWRPTQSSQPNMHPPLATPDASLAMGPAGNNAFMGVRPDNPNVGWGPMQANPTMGWGNPTTGNPNMNWGPAVQPPPPGNTPGWVAPPGNTGPNVQGMVAGNPNPGWAPTQNWGPPPVQGQAPVSGWGMPGGNAGGPPPPAQGPAPANGWGLPSGNSGGPPPPAQGPPQGNTNQGWVATPTNQGAWSGEQNHMGSQFSGQRGAQGRDAGFNGGRPWNRQSSFGSGGGPRQVRKRDTICPYNANGRCRKGVHCDYLHT